MVREGWQNDSQCTITLVFRFGPNELSFWTHLCVDISSYSFLFFSSLFLAWSSLQWKHILVMPHCCSLFRFLITNSITRMGWRELVGAQASERLGTLVLHSLCEKDEGVGLSDGDTKPQITNINFLHLSVIMERENKL